MRTAVRHVLTLSLVMLAVAACTMAVAPVGFGSLPSGGNRIEFKLPGPPAPTDTVWLCRPGLAQNPCQSDLTATEVQASGSARVLPAVPTADPPIDCFYVYPTVSHQKTTNASLRIDPEQRAAALIQAAAFSSVCRVYAPMYPQLTMSAIGKLDQLDLMSAVTAYEGVWRAYRDYMAHYNHGRGVVFIGHSQGAFMLEMLLRTEVDSEPKVHRRMLSALLMGGNVTVPIGQDVGGYFASIRACRSAEQLGCVVAYSTYGSTPPNDALFGRIDSPLNPFGETGDQPLQVLCTNPASLKGGSGMLDPYFPTRLLANLMGASAVTRETPRTSFVTYPGEFQASCETNGSNHWLQVTRVTGSADHRPTLAKVGSARWGLHTVDISLALGNLIELVKTETVAYERMVRNGLGSERAS